jgi:hypothetical protein
MCGSLPTFAKIEYPLGPLKGLAGALYRGMEAAQVRQKSLNRNGDKSAMSCRERQKAHVITAPAGMLGCCALITC